MRIQSLCFISLLLGPQLVHAQAESVQIFPERELLQNREEIDVTVRNETDQDIFCEYILSPVIYRSQATQNNLDDVIFLNKQWIPKNFILKATVGKERTAALRKSGIYADAYIDVVKNEFLTNYTQCIYKEMPPAEKKAFFRKIGSLEEIKRQLPIYQLLQISDGTRFPTDHILSFSDDNILIQERRSGPVPHETLAANDFLLAPNGDIKARGGIAANIGQQPFFEYKMGTAAHIQTLQGLLYAFSTNGPFMVGNNQELKDLMFGHLEKLLKKAESLKKISEGMAGTDMFKSQSSGKCLNLKTTALGFDGKREGDLIHQWDCPPPNNPWTNNYWQILANADGSVQLRSEYSGLCLAKKSAVRVGGNQIVTQASCEQAASFFMDRPGNGGIALRIVNEDLCVTLSQEQGGYQNGEAFVYTPCQILSNSKQIFYSENAH